MLLQITVAIQITPHVWYGSLGNISISTTSAPANEKWVGHVRRSAVDVIRIASELLHAFAELHIPVPAELVAQCTDGVDAVLQGWVLSSCP